MVRRFDSADSRKATSLDLRHASSNLATNASEIRAKLVGSLSLSLQEGTGCLQEADKTEATQQQPSAQKETAEQRANHMV